MVHEEGEMSPPKPKPSMGGLHDAEPQIPMR